MFITDSQFTYIDADYGSNLYLGFKYLLILRLHKLFNYSCIYMTSLKFLYGKSMFIVICYWWLIIRTIVCESEHKKM